MVKIIYENKMNITLIFTDRPKNVDNVLCAIYIENENLYEIIIYNTALKAIKEALKIVKQKEYDSSNILSGIEDT